MATSRSGSTRVRRRPTRAGVVLDPGLIIDTALRLIEAPGGNALTVRRLGVELGADPTAIYRYFRNLDALLLAIADRLVVESLDGYQPGPDWEPALRELAGRLHASMLRHPRLAMLRAVRFTAGPYELKAADLGIGLLMSAGFSAAEAVRHYRDVIETVLSLAVIDASELTPEQQRSEDEALTSAYASLSETEFPHLAAAREHLPELADSAVPTVLDRLIDSLAREAGERRKT
ncbi:TetR/AcrR family transcriptional regulator [Actinoplanes sp. NPDC051851]|uniref:TetR/AcrR family transcriptional regulator n=1 Tax=Actinoplanes sp. NPDC051851 TaxID=3154753 RepID=UPI003433CFD6